MMHNLTEFAIGSSSTASLHLPSGDPARKLLFEEKQQESGPHLGSPARAFWAGSRVVASGPG